MAKFAIAVVLAILMAQGWSGAKENPLQVKMDWKPDIKKMSFSEFRIYQDINAFLKAGGELNYTSETSPGITPLEICINEGYLQTTKFLLLNGADVNSSAMAKGMARLSPLYLAVAKRNMKMVDLLFRFNAKPRGENILGGNGLLGVAAKNGDVEIATALIKGGAKELMNDLSGGSLNVACKHGHIAMVKLLLKNGSNPNGKKTANASPLEEVLSSKKIYDLQITSIKKIADILNKEKVMNVFRDSKLAKNPIRLQIANLLIEAGADVNAKNKDRQAPLMLALKKGSWHKLRPLAWALIKLLVESGADLNAKTIEKEVIWHEIYLWHLNHVSQNEDPISMKKVAEFLFSNKAKIDASGNGGTIMLRLTTIMNGYDSAVLTSMDPLLKYKPNLQLLDKNKKSLLRQIWDTDPMWFQGHIEFVKKLISAGAKIDDKAKDGESLRSLMIRDGHVKLYESLQKKK